MHYTLLQFLILLFVAFMLILLAQKVKISYPIFLVLAGLGISYIPGIPEMSIDPEVIFLIFLPPLLYEAAWYTSWNDFWKWRRPISLLAFGLVIITSLAVAFITSSMIPGFTLAMGFLVGGIVSPPDAIAATSVLKNITVPKRITTILEGESLVNDASSLIVLRFALAAVITGQFSLSQATTDFFLSTIMGIVIGLAVAHVLYLIHRFLPTTASIDSALTLISPYFMYLAAEQFHYSGVMAVVSGGLFLSYRSHEIFTDGQSRLQAINVWSTLTIILNAFVFILIGLELPIVMAGLEGYSLWEAISYGLIISAVVIVLRIAWIYPVTFIPRWLSKKVREREAHPGWKIPFVIGWAGMRGVVSLAAALSLPITTAANINFPHRNLIIFITFVVILVTLVFQGLTLPYIIKAIKVDEIDPIVPEEQQESTIKLRLLKISLMALEEKYSNEIQGVGLISGLKEELENSLSNASRRLESMECQEIENAEMEAYNDILKDIYKLQRQELHKIRKEKVFSDEVIRKQEMQIDLSDTKIPTGKRIIPVKVKNLKINQ
ncbi:Na+/H+ antiporter [Pedobacter rhizosphaerae]|uniref:Sodium/proton antiporter, CPA1 family n=1 Tax=Pedobacter rhizosphaerae TaxID=390241 RepID=A0A1H9TE26_9SPHI|nr:Na+/H+ antiporter [Pedobacter rhizosphaerae]SER95452.1 sodium/proton antiporter, CPA1 family [Pedobacter rhizosphaerae]